MIGHSMDDKCKLLNILHIEGDDGDAKIIQRACLKEFGAERYRLTRVKTFASGLKEVQASNYTVILLDLNLGDTEGVSNIRLIKREKPDTPIVVLSGHDDTETALQAIRAGAQEYLIKEHITSRSIGLGLLTSIERKKYERELFNQATHDQLTGLANRRAFIEHMSQWLAEAKRWNQAACILFMDVNDFKSVNDTYGHEVGDELLKKIGIKLKETLRSSDMLARYGGDEFVVRLDMGAHSSKTPVLDLIHRIHQVFEEPVLIDCVNMKKIKTGVSIGTACFPNDGEDITTLIQSADHAMYQVKNQPD